MCTKTGLHNKVHTQVLDTLMWILSKANCMAEKESTLPFEEKGMHVPDAPLRSLGTAARAAAHGPSQGNDGNSMESEEKKKRRIDILIYGPAFQEVPRNAPDDWLNKNIMVDVKTTNATTKEATNKYNRSTSSAFVPGRAGVIAEDKLRTHQYPPETFPGGAYTLTAFAIEYGGRLNPDGNRLLQAAAIRAARRVQGAGEEEGAGSGSHRLQAETSRYLHLFRGAISIALQQAVSKRFYQHIAEAGQRGQPSADGINQVGLYLFPQYPAVTSEEETKCG